MTQMDPRLMQTLRTIATEVGTLHLKEPEVITQTVQDLQAVMQAVPDTVPELTTLLQLAAAGLQRIQHYDNGQRQDIVDMLAMTMDMAEQCLLNGQDADRISLINEIRTALGRMLKPDDPAASTTAAVSPPVPETAATLSLDDAAALLLTLDPGDTEDVLRIRQALQARATQKDAVGGPGVRSMLTEAVRELDKVLNGRSKRPGDAIEEASRFLEFAMESLHEAPTAARSSPPAKAAPPAPPPPAKSAPPAPPPLVAAQSTAPAPIADGAIIDLLPPDTDRELLGDFITEGREYISQSEAALLALETNPEDMEAVNTVFRAFHTVKGTAAFMGLTPVSELAHLAESLLSRMRDGEIRCTDGYADLALRATDMLKDFMQLLQDALGGASVTLPSGHADLMQLLAHPEAVGETSEPPPRLGNILVAEGRAEREDVETAAASSGSQPLGVALLRSGAASLPDVAHALRTQQRMSANENTTVESSVRVRTDRLDRLIDMVGELVIAHSMVAQDEVVLHGGHHDLLKKVGHTGKIVRELQDLSMAMRMVPLKAMFQKMTRVVRDIAQKSSKNVVFRSEGEDTEVDRNMVDVIADPLVHMVRNAVDHGIEAPALREKAGKSATGTVRLVAYHAGGHVVVELHDDGKGLDREKIVAKALSKGLIETDKNMSDNDVYNLIFQPGFSTAEQVTDISGRGVGMDVVRRSIEALKGRIEITSELGKGTIFAVYLPLTLAITDGMLVQVGGERYIIPTTDIYMSFRPSPDMLSTVGGRGELVMLRGELIPLIRLHRLFEVPEAIEDPIQGLLVAINNGERHCALLVDELLGQQQVVAKSLGASLGHPPGIAGGAILGDGRVGLILDPAGIITLSKNTVSRRMTNLSSQTAA